MAEGRLNVADRLLKLSEYLRYLKPKSDLGRLPQRLLLLLLLPRAITRAVRGVALAEQQHAPRSLRVRRRWGRPISIVQLAIRVSIAAVH